MFSMSMKISKKRMRNLWINLETLDIVQRLACIHPSKYYDRSYEQGIWSLPESGSYYEIKYLSINTNYHLYMYTDMYSKYMSVELFHKTFTKITKNNIDIMIALYD
jgi:hypothetical protein